MKKTPIRKLGPSSIKVKPFHFWWSVKWWEKGARWELLFRNRKRAKDYGLLLEARADDDVLRESERKRLL